MAGKSLPCIIACRDGFISCIYYREESVHPWNDPDTWYDVAIRAAAEWQTSDIVFVSKRPNGQPQYQRAATWDRLWIAQPAHYTIAAALAATPRHPTPTKGRK